MSFTAPQWQRMVRFLAWSNVAFSFLAALLGAAPFTPAPLAFAATLPAATALARCGATTPALCVVAALVLAVWASPITLEQLLQYPAAVWSAWVGLWAAGAMAAAIASQRAAARAK